MRLLRRIYFVESGYHQIYEAEASLRTKLITCPFYRCQKREQHAAGIKLVKGMCRNCKKRRQPVRDDAMDMQKLKAEIDELKREVAQPKSAAARVRSNEAYPGSTSLS